MYRAELDEHANLPLAATNPQATSREAATNPQATCPPNEHPFSMPDLALYAGLYRETLFKLERHEKLAREGKALEDAIAFARFVQWSCIVPILKAYPSERPKIDGAHLQWRAEELERTCQSFWLGNGTVPAVQLAELEAIHDKLDLIAGHIAKLQVNAHLGTDAPRRGEASRARQRALADPGAGRRSLVPIT